MCKNPASSLSSSYFESDEQSSDWAIVKWLSYSQFWPKNPQTPTQNHPRTNHISLYSPIKDFQESAGSSYKTLEKEPAGKGSAAGKPFNFAINWSKWKSVEEINTSSVSSAT